MSKIQAAMGINGAKVEIIEIEGDKFYWNAIVRGTLRLTGGIEDQTIDKFSVRLVCHTRVPARNGYEDAYEYFSETPLAAHLTVKAGTVQEFPFAVRVPNLASPSGLDILHKPLEWFVQGIAHLHHAVDASGGAEVTIHCPASLDSLAHAVERAAPIALLLRYTHRGGNPVVTFTFEPTEEGKQSIEGVKLEVEEKEGQVIGTLQISPQPHSFTAQLRSLAEKDSLHHVIAFPLAALASEKIEAEEESGVMAQLREWFRPFLPASEN